MVQRSDPNHKTIQVVEERAVITKHRKLTGGVRVRTVVHEDEAIVDQPLGTEQVEVTRVPLDRWVEAPIPVRQEGDTTILTLHEEVTVVEKRLRAVEEFHLTRERSTRNAPKHIALRREEAVIEHLEVLPTRKTQPNRLLRCSAEAASPTIFRTTTAATCIWRPVSRHALRRVNKSLHSL